VQTRLFIEGEFVDALHGATMPVFNPFNNSQICEVSSAQAEDIDRAVEAARRAFSEWKRVDAAERGELLLKLAVAIEQNAEELALLESRDTGHPLRDARNLDVPRTARCFRYFGGMADKLEGFLPPVYPGFLNYVQREPIGIVGQIVPWNFPLMFTSWKLAPALAAGNCVVMKPAELTPLSSLRIAELINEAGFPPGVVNILPGFGSTAGVRLAEHPDIGKVSFTGSTETGRNIVRMSAGNLKKLQLELGGKGANIVFDDADIDKAVKGSASAIFHNQGQACIAGSRLILHEAITDEFLEKFIPLAESIRLGDPLDPLTEMGPLTSKAHQERVIDYCKIAVEEGGEILTGGKVPDHPALANGCFVEPTVVRARPTDRACQEEVFGPFVSVMTFASAEEALTIANDVSYGLGSGIWTSDLQRAHRVAGELHAGMVWINAYKIVHPGSPFGGVGQSGYGREMGFEVMREYTQPKSVWVNVDANIPDFYQRPAT